MNILNVNEYDEESLKITTLFKQFDILSKSKKVDRLNQFVVLIYYFYICFGERIF